MLRVFSAYPEEMELASPRVRFRGCTPNPDEPWMRQAGRTLGNAEDGFLRRQKYFKFCILGSGSSANPGRERGRPGPQKFSNIQMLLLMVWAKMARWRPSGEGMPAGP